MVSPKDMSDQELIELVQNQLPQHLTEPQLLMLRRVMRTSPALREVLLEELRLETGLAARFAPQRLGADEFIAHIERLAAERRRSRRFWLWGIVLIAGSLAAGAMAIVANLGDDGNDSPGLVIDTPGGSNHKGREVNKGDADALNNVAAGAAGKTAKSPSPDTNDHGNDPNGDNADANGGHRAVKALPPMDPPWRLFDDPAARGDYRWTTRLERVLRPVANAQMRHNEQQHYFDLSGLFDLTPPDEHGTTVRLRLSDVRRWRMTFWAGNQGARIEMDPSRRLRGMRITRVDANDPLHGLPEGVDQRFRRENVVGRIDPKIEFNWGEGAAISGADKENFAVRWTGQVIAPRDGRYRFITTSDDGVAVYIAGKRIINDWGSHAAAEARGEIDLKAGSHDIVVEYFENNGSALMKLEWEGPGINRQVVPTQALRAGADADARQGLYGRYCYGGTGPPPPPDRAQLVGDDGWKWHMLYEGAVDLRYQNGYLLLARGDIVVQAVPMPMPPTAARLEYEGRLWLADRLRLEPLAWTGDPQPVALSLADAKDNADGDNPTELADPAGADRLSGQRPAPNGQRPAPDGQRADRPADFTWRLEPVNLTDHNPERLRVAQALRDKRRELNADTPKLAAAQKQWEKDTAASGWLVLDPMQVVGPQGVEFEMLDDGSVLVGGQNPAKATYRLVARGKFKGVTAVRLEALADPSLPNGGPGRGGGNFVLTGFVIQAAPMNDPARINPLGFSAAEATFQQGGFNVTDLLDNKPDGGWAVGGRTGQSSSAMFVLNEPVTLEGESVLHISLAQQSPHSQHNLGRFRLSVTTAPQPRLDTSVVPLDVAAALKVKADERSDERAALLKAYYRSIAPTLQPVRQQIKQLDQQLTQFPVLARLDTHDNGAVKLTRNPVPGRIDQIWAVTELDIGAGAVVTMHVDGATAGTGVFAGMPISDHREQIYIDRSGLDRVFVRTPFNDQQVRLADEHGYAFANGFYCRFIYKFDGVWVQFSGDGEHWGSFDQFPFDVNQPWRPRVTVGLMYYPRAGDYHVRLDSLRVDRFGALERLADAALVQRVPVAAWLAAQKPAQPDRLLMAMDRLYAAAPAKVSAAQWRLACNAALMRGPTTGLIRQSAAMDLVRAAIDQGAAFDKLLDALRELPWRVSFTQDRRQAFSWWALHDLYDRLARRIWATGDRARLAALADAWWAQPFSREAAGYNLPEVAPLSLMRLALYDRMANGDWSGLRHAAMRYEFLSRNGHGQRRDEGAVRSLNTLAAWAIDRAATHLDDGPEDQDVGDRPERRTRQWQPHPLVVDSDRETLNTVAEFLASVETKAYDHACRILTRYALPDGIAPVDGPSGDGQLFKATYVLLRQAIDSDAQLARTLRQNYGPVGMIRLQQALQQGRIDELESLATQFHGTAAARQAVRHLADRDLSMGNFFAAAEQYRSLLPAAADDSQRNDIIAHGRLAMAMAGQLLEGDDHPFAKPVAAAVTMAGQTLSAQQFEQLISTLAKQRRVGSAATVTGMAADVRAPGPHNVKLSRLMDLRLPGELKNQWYRMREIGAAIDGRRLYLHQHARLYAIDLKQRKVLWQQEQSGRDFPGYAARPADPVVVGKRLYVNFFRDRKLGLTCFDADTGNELWRQTFDHSVIGDPVMVGRWLYVLSAQMRLGDYVDVVLRRIMPDTGESVLAQRVVRVRYGESAYRVGRPVLVGDALVFRTGNALVCCDLLGSTRWIRRLSFVPPSVDSLLFDHQALSELIVAGDRVIATCPASPRVLCVDGRSGAEVWSYVQPYVRRLVGRIGDKVIVSAEGSLEALDIATGKVLWQAPTTSHHDAVLPAADDTLVTVTLDRIENAGNRRPDERGIRRVQWRSAADGKVLGAAAVPDDARDVFDSQTLFTDGHVIAALTNVPTGGGNPQARLVLLEPAGKLTKPKPIALLERLSPAKLKWGPWQVLGPFNVGNFDKAYRTAFEPEQKVDLKATYDNGKLKWAERRDWTDGQIHELTGNDATTYLFRTVDAPANGMVSLSLGSDDSIKVWVNGELVLAHHIGRGVAPDQELISVPLHKGPNELLMKIVNGPMDYAFYFKPQ